MLTTIILKQKRPESVHLWVLHRSNMCLHIEGKMQEYVNKKNVLDATFSLKYRLGCLDFALYPALKGALRGRIYQSNMDAMKTVKVFFKQLLNSSFSDACNK